MQFLKIEIGLDLTGSILLIVFILMWAVGLIAIGMGIERRWGK